MTAEKELLDEITTISSEQELVDIFGKPNANNFEEFFALQTF